MLRIVTKLLRNTIDNYERLMLSSITDRQRRNRMAKYTTISVTLTDDLVDQIKGCAEREGVSVSAVARWALRRYFLPADVTDRNEDRDYSEQPASQGIPS